MYKKNNGTTRYDEGINMSQKWKLNQNIKRKSMHSSQYTTIWEISPPINCRNSIQCSLLVKLRPTQG